MTVIGELLLGRSLGVALRGVEGGVRAFLRNDALGRLFVLLHGDFGERTDLSRDVFYSWRAQEPLREMLEAVIAGRCRPEPDSVEELGALIAPRLVRTAELERVDVAREIAEAAFAAAPYVAEGGSQATALILGRLEPGQQELLEAIRGRTPSAGEDVNLAAALVVGPLRHIGAADDVQAAEQAADTGDHAGAADALVLVADRLSSAGLAFAGDTLRERAATYFAAAQDLANATRLLQCVIEARVEQGTLLYRPSLEVLRELLASEDLWVADALEALAVWPEQPDAALHHLQIAAERSEGRADHLRWLASYVELLGMSGDTVTILEVTADARTRQVEAGPRLMIELEALEALDNSDREAAEAGWRELLRWGDEQAGPFDRALVWQRRGVLLARREQVPEAHDAYRRAMSSWAELPGYEEQTGDAFFSLQSVSIANAKPIPDPELRPIAFALRGSSDTPAGRVERDRQQGMASRLDDRLPDALSAFWRAFARSRRVGSLQGVLELAARLAELYEHSGESIPALRLYIAAGKGKEAKQLATRMSGAQLREALDNVGGSRWERASTYQVLAAGGRLLPEDITARFAPQLLAEAAGQPDAWVAPQPTLAAKRALAHLAFNFPEELRVELWRQLLSDLGHPQLDIVKEVAQVLVPATNLGLVDAEHALIERFLDDPFNTGISFVWVAERAAANPELLERVRASAREGNSGALEALAAGDLIGDDEALRALCSEQAGRAAGIRTIEETQQDGTTSTRVEMGIRLEGPATVARAAAPAQRELLLNRLLEIVTDEREPEGNRASAVAGLFNLAPALTAMQAERVAAAIGAIALGHYELSRWDDNMDHPLSRFRISFHTANSLRASAIGTLAQLTAKHLAPATGDLQEAIAAAFRDGPESVTAAGLDAAARVPDLDVPFPLEALMRDSDPSIRLQSLIAWVARHDGLPGLDNLAALIADPDFQVRQQLMGMAAGAGEQGRTVLTQLAEHDPDSYIRLRASAYLASANE